MSFRFAPTRVYQVWAHSVRSFGLAALGRSTATPPTRPRFSTGVANYSDPTPGTENPMSSSRPTDTAPAYQARTFEQLAAALRSGDQPDWLMFWGHRPEPDGQVGISCLSQWYPAAFTVEGTAYPSAEHFMMAAKARVFRDAAAEASILNSATASEAKRLGRRVRGFDEITWARHREMAVFIGNVAKFHQNPALGAFLASTETRVLVEASPYDPIWGIGLRASDPRAVDPDRWPGQNLLGFTLMNVRANLAA